MANILSDLGDLVFTGRAYTKSSLVRFLDGRTDHDEETIRKAYGKFKDRAYVDQDFQFEDAAKAAFAELGIRALLPEFLQYTKDVSGIVLLPGVKDTVDALIARGDKFYGLTDCMFRGEAVEGWLADQGLHLSGVVSSKDIELAKGPGSTAWEVALARLGLQEKPYFLAHDWDELYGAYHKGYDVIACNHNPEDDRLDFIPAERKLSTFSDLLTLRLD